MLIPFLTVRYLIFAGEALSPVKLKDWHDRHPEIKLINMYGITETTVHSTYKEIGEKEMISGSSNIGQPLPTVSMVVLDECLRLVPEGIPGELFVGGEGVARGYWRREDLTLQRFILNPYDPAERLYRSGDLVRILDSGDLEYAGRIDHQVKLRGFRIEPGEIETQLAGYPGIKDIAVLLKEVNGENVLVAYYASAEEIEGAAFRSFLSARLPDYMIPSYFVHLDRLPLTTNGKLDKKSLVTPEIKKAANYQKPVNQIQIELVKIWSEVLDIDSDKIGISTNFFDLAGNSIKLVKLAYKINHHFNTNISVATLFKFPAISLIADFLTGERQVAAQPDRNTLEDALVQKVETIELLNRINSK
jgi:acyl carrier protein